MRTQEERVKLCTDSKMNSEVNVRFWSCEPAALPTVPSCHTATFLELIFQCCLKVFNKALNGHCKNMVKPLRNQLHMKVLVQFICHMYVNQRSTLP